MLRVSKVVRLADRHHDDLENWVIFIFLVPLALLLVLESALSLHWRLGHDTSLMHYVAFLTDQHGYAPYRDVFEPNAPGTFLFHLLVVKLFGYGNVGFMAFNLLWLGALLGVTWAILKQFGWRVAWGGIILFGLFYLQAGRPMMLQRDYVLVLPISLAILVGLSQRFSPSVKAVLIGLLIGASATIKPHAAIALPFIMLFDLAESPGGRLASQWTSRWGLTSRIFLYLAGFSLPILGSIAWVWQSGGLPQMIEIFTEYLPLHRGINNKHETMFGFATIARYLIKNYLELGGYGIWLAAAFLGIFVALFHAKLPAGSRRTIYLIAGFTVAFSLYVLAAGQFWPYHWMPFNYFVILLAALCLIELPKVQNSVSLRLFPISVLIITSFFALGPTPDLINQLRGKEPYVLEGQRVDEIAGYLRANLDPGDKVQPLDWTGGAVHGMLLARAELATRFMYDYHFYHHISHPFIQTLRSRFIDDLEKSSPRYIIQVETLKPWVSGPDTTRNFKELQSVLREHYSPVLTGDGYVIYERRTQ